MKINLTEVETREKDIQVVCEALIYNLEYDNNGNIRCPHCFSKRNYNAENLHDLEHEPNCAYLIAKDLMTNITKIDYD